MMWLKEFIKNEPVIVGAIAKWAALLAVEYGVIPQTSQATVIAAVTTGLTALIAFVVRNYVTPTAKVHPVKHKAVKKPKR